MCEREREICTEERRNYKNVREIPGKNCISVDSDDKRALFIAFDCVRCIAVYFHYNTCVYVSAICARYLVERGTWYISKAGK